MYEHDFQGIALGDIVKDRLTGFSGTVTGAVAYITGCHQLLVTPSTTDSTKSPEAAWIDVSRCAKTGHNPESDAVMQLRQPDSGADLLPPIR